jgi:hypothetical protein
MFNFACDLHVSGRDGLRNIVRIFFLIVSLTVWNGTRLTAQTAQFKQTAPMLHRGVATHYTAGAAGFFVASATETALTVSPSSPVAVGTPITLTATVTTGGNPVSLGTINFCDATATYCEDSALLGTAQLTPSGTASIKLRLGIGTHSIKAVFAGTNGDTSSLSSAQSVTVTGTYPTATTIGYSGMAGNYTLTAMVAGSGDVEAGPSGSVSFLDTTTGNAALGTAALGALTTVQGFAKQVPYHAGVNPISVATGDFNEDGKLDLAVVNHGSNSISIFLGDGDGTFQSQKAYATGSEPTSVVVADFNGDGKPDLVVANDNATTVSVLLGNGDGTFQSQKAYTTGSVPVFVAVGDFDRDGKLDLVVANSLANTVSVLLGNGDGTFQSQKTYATGNNPYSVAVDDFNGDGKLDLVVANVSDDTVSVLLGNGDGTFQSEKTYETGPGPISVAVGDFNGDGKPDLVVANDGGNTVSVLLGNGDGTFQSQKTYATGSTPWSAAVGDFNKDGKLDIVVPNLSDNTVSVLLGNGDGTFQSQKSYATANGSESVAVGDFDGDGEPDLAVADSSNVVSVLLDQLALITTAQLAGVPIPGIGTQAVDATYPSDANYGASTSGSITLNANQIATTTTTFRVTPLTAIYGQPVQLTATVVPSGGLEPNGQVKFCDATAASCENSALLGTAQLTPAGTASIKLRPPIGTHSIKAVFTGTNGDGGSSSSTQIVTITGTYSTTTTISAAGVPGNFTFTATVVGYGENGTGLTGGVSFEDTTNGNAVLGTATLGVSMPVQAFALPVSYGIGGDPDSVAVGDFNGDGEPDLVAANLTTNTGVSVLLGNGDGTFQNALGYPTNFSVYSVAVGDFNGDGKLDLVIVGSGDSVGVLLGKGNGTFQKEVDYPVGAFPISVAVGDLNGDGKLDLVVADSNSNAVSILLGNGDGTFQNQENYATGIDPFSIALGDFNGDGNLDLAVTNYVSNTVSVLLGNGDGTFQGQKTYATGSEPNSVAVGDFNGDGKLDLVVTNSYSNNNTVSVLLGNGNGTFQSQKTYATGVLPFSVAVGDFNGDGKLDLAVGDAGGAVPNENGFGTASILLGNGDGTFQKPMNYVASGEPFSVAVGDFNQDGRPDLAVAEYPGGVSVLLNQLTAQTATAQSINPLVPGTGTHEIDAKYSGDTSYSPSVSGTVTVTGTLIPTTTTLSVAPGTTVNYGQTITFTATVAHTSGTDAPTGTVTFYDGATQLGSPFTLNGNQASYQTSALTAATHVITATYSGDSVYALSSGIVTEQVVNVPASIKVVSGSGQTASIGQAFTNSLVVLVTNVNNLPVPNATVTFKGMGISFSNGGVAVTGSNGQASIIATPMQTGSLQATASVAGVSIPATFALSGSQKTHTNTTTTLLATPKAIIGEPVTLNASVWSPLGRPTGTVTFQSGGMTLGTSMLNSSAVATLITTSLPLGTDSVTAGYAGSASADPSASPAVNVVIVRLGTTTTLLTTPKADLGGPVTLNASVWSSLGRPTGTVTFQSGGMTLGTATLNSSGLAGLITTKLSLGTDSVTASYGGSGGYESSTSPAVSVLINPAPTTTTLVQTLGPDSCGNVVGGQIILTATVQSQFTGTPGGTITFSDYGKTLATVPLNNSGVATFTTTSLPLGYNLLMANYGGQGNFAASIAHPVLAIFIPRGITSNTLFATPRVVVGGPVILNASVREVSEVAPPVGGPITGSVTFQSDGVTLGTVPLDSALDANLTTTSLPVGTHTMTAIYPGTPCVTASTSPPVHVIVSPPLTTTALTVSSSEVTTGAAVTLTAMVKSQKGTPSGTVTFMNEGTTLAMVPLNNSGVASFTTTSLPLGVGSLTASYGGSPNFSSSISPAVWILVMTPAGTITTLLVTPRAVVGAPVTLNASVRSLRSGLPSGVVTFQSGSMTLGTVTLNSSADASLITTSLPPGTDAVTASYGGSVNYDPSTSPAAHVVISQAAMKSALRASPPR